MVFKHIFPPEIVLMAYFRQRPVTGFVLIYCLRSLSEKEL